MICCTFDGMCTKLRSSQAREGATVTNVRSSIQGNKEEYGNASPQERAHGSTGSRNNVDGRKRRHFGGGSQKVENIGRVCRSQEKWEIFQIKEGGASIRVKLYGGE